MRVLLPTLPRWGWPSGTLQGPAVWLSLQGACPAGGCMMALSCDFRVLADNPKYHIGLNETLLGIVAPFW